MKSVRRIMSLVLMMFLVFGLSGCDLFGAKLESPKNFKIQEGIASWSSVSGAEKYLLAVDEQVYDVTSTTFDLNALELAVGSYQVKVASVKGTTVSEYTQEVTYVVVEEIISSLLAPVDLVFESGVLTWESVENALSYRVMIGEDTYTTTQTSFDLNPLGLFAGQYSIKVVALRGEIMSPDSTPILFTQLPLVNVQSLFATLLLIIDESYVPNMTQANFSDSFEYESYQNNCTMLLRYSQIMAEMMMSEENSLILFEKIKDMSMNIGNYESFTSMRSDLDTFKDLGLTTEKMVYLIVELATEVIEVNNDETDLESNQKMTSILNMIEEERDLLDENLTMVIDYMTDIYTSISPNVIALFDDVFAGGDLSEEEVMIIKDEIASILLENLPSIQDFENLYELILIIASEMSELELTDLITQKTNMATILHSELTLALKLVGFIDLEMINTFITLSNEMVIEGQYYEVEQFAYCDFLPPYYDVCYPVYETVLYKEDNKVDPLKALDLILFIGQNLKTFYLENQTDFASLMEVDFEDLATSFANEYIDLMKMYLQASSGISEEELTHINSILDKIPNEIPYIFDGMKILVGKDIQLINQFLDTEASMFYDLISLVQAINNNEVEETEIIIELEEIFAQFVDYNDILFAELDNLQVATLLRMVRLPLTFILEQQGVMEIGEAELVFDNLLQPVSQVLANLIVIEQNVVSTIANNEVYMMIFQTLQEENIQISLIYTATNLLDELITVDIENLVYETIDIVFSDILINDTISSLMGEVNLVDVRTMIEENVGFVITQIREIADFDFDNLTQEQLDQISSFLSIFNQPSEQPM